MLDAMLRKANQQVCTCGAYHFPHRRGSGLCGHPERFDVEWLNATYPRLTRKQRELVLQGKAYPKDFKETG